MNELYDAEADYRADAEMEAEEARLAKHEDERMYPGEEQTLYYTTR